MALRFPESMDECVYFTRRKIKENGKIVAWVFKEKCPQCGKALMGKPKDPKTGKTKIRAKEYVCPQCKHTEGQEYEDKLTTSIQYTCQHCNHEDETQVPFKRKKVSVFDEEKQKKVSVDVIRFQCGKCKQNIDIAKKMKV